MRARTKVLGAAAVAAVACASALPAFADDFTPLGTARINHVSDVYSGTGPHGFHAATVSFSYLCHGTAQTDHLFVAVKQGPNVQVGSSSSDAVTFYSTNLRSDKAPNALNCDGAVHKMHTLLMPDPGFWQQHHPNPPLANGQAFLQICLYDATGLTMNYSDARVHVSS